MNLTARVGFAVRLKRANPKRIEAITNLNISPSKLAEIDVEKSERLINPKIEETLKNLRGVFTIYKPPHTHPDQVKREVDVTLLEYFNKQQGIQSVIFAI